MKDSTRFMREIEQKIQSKEIKDPVRYLRGTLLVEGSQDTTRKLKDLLKKYTEKDDDEQARRTFK